MGACCVKKDAKAVLPVHNTLFNQINALIEGTDSMTNVNSVIHTESGQQAQSKFLYIKTNVNPQEIFAVPYTPDGTMRALLPFSCPICMRFFNHMLKSQCCRNYVCYFCAQEIQEAQNGEECKCPHCNCLPLLLADVGFDSPVKKYSDSPIKAIRNKDVFIWENIVMEQISEEVSVIQATNANLEEDSTVNRNSPLVS